MPLTRSRLSTVQAMVKALQHDVHKYHDELCREGLTAAAQDLANAVEAIQEARSKLQDAMAADSLRLR